MTPKISICCIILFAICISVVIAEQKLVSNETKFISGNFNYVQFNQNHAGICNGPRHKDIGYDYPQDSIEDISKVGCASPNKKCLSHQCPACSGHFNASKCWHKNSLGESCPCSQDIRSSQAMKPGCAICKHFKSNSTPCQNIPTTDVLPDYHAYMQYAPIELPCTANGSHCNHKRTCIHNTK